MSAMGRKILIGAVLLFFVFIIVVSTRPSTFHIERSMSIAAPPEVAFAEVNDFHRWAKWSPFENLDPQMTKTFEGPASGPGASYAWKGNDKAGEGRMTIEKVQQGALISIKLQFLKPFPATNTATFTFAPEGTGSRVTWAMDGNNNFMSKLFQMFMNMDKMVGPDFERGLASLKTVAETAAKNAPPPAAPIKPAP